MAKPTRRQVLAGATVAAATALVGSAARAGSFQRSLPKRTFGRSERELPVLGLGCFPLGQLEEEAAGVSVVRRAFEGGARYFDTAPSYNRGVSERRLGLGLKEFPREECWIATKTLERDGDAALAELEQSLERLGMEYVDSVQIHELRSKEDVEGLFRPGGVVKALEDARERGKLRHIGVTGHRDPKFLLQAIEAYPFVSALVPVNPLDCHHLSFTRTFVPAAAKKGVAVVAMKVYAGGSLPAQKPDLAIAELVAFALAQPGVCVAVPGADSPERWGEAHEGALAEAPDGAAQAALIAAAGPHRGKPSEWYKNES